MNIPAARIYFPDEDKEKISEQIKEVLTSGMLTLGKYCKQFEMEFAKFVGTKYAITVNSGTSALEIPLRALDIVGSSVIVPTNTFFATPASVIHAGGSVIFTDVADDLSLNPDSVNEAIQKNTKGIITVHIGGMVSPHIKALEEICEDNNLFLMEDAAAAHGSMLDEKKAGSFGNVAAFSFYPTKLITSAEGGMITTNDEKIYNRALVFRDQGKAGFSRNFHVELGYNWRMSEVHAVIGLSQFKRLQEFIEKRRNIAKIFDKRIGEIKKVTPIEIPANSRSNYYKYIVLLDEGIDRTEIKNILKEKYKISLSGEVFEVPCHLQPVFKKLGYKEGDFPVAEDLCRRQICLPIFPIMTEEEANYIIDSLKEVIT